MALRNIRVLTYVGLSILSKGLPFISFIIYQANNDIESVGKYSWYFLLMSFISLFTNHGVQSTISNDILNYRQPTLVGHLKKSWLIVFIAGLLTYIQFNFIGLILVMGAYLGVSLSLQSIYLARKRQIFSVLPLLVFNSIWLLIVYFYDATFEEQLLLFNILNFPLFVSSFFFVKFPHIFNIDRLVLAITYLIQSLSQFGISYADNIMLKYELGYEELGYYSKEMRVSFILNTIITVIVTYYAPLVVENRKLNDAITKIEKMLFLFILILGVIFVLFGCTIYHIIYGENADLIGKTPFSNVTYLLIGSIFFGMYMVRIIYNRILESKRINLLVTSSCVFLNIFLNWILLGEYGRFGAGIATMLTYLVLFTLSSILIYIGRKNVISFN